MRVGFGDEEKGLSESSLSDFSNVDWIKTINKVDILSTWHEVKNKITTNKFWRLQELFQTFELGIITF